MSGDETPPGVAPRVYHVTDEDPVGFAGRELGEYLSRLLGRRVPVAQRDASERDGQTDALWVGPASAFDGVSAPPVDDPELDDGVVVETDGTAGLVAGTNPRSVLLAAYRYLRELGCRWVRPGPEGGVVPEREALPPVSLSTVPSYRYRGVCLEGVVSVDHVTEMVDFLPKLGFNSYFPQLPESYPFFERWYEAHDNPYRDGQPFSGADAREHRRECAREMEKRGLVRHDVGHGWTNEVFDTPAKGWDVWTDGVPADRRAYMAKVDGERALQGRGAGVPLKTELCYSNPAARRALVDVVCDYAAANPGVDYLHVWQSDGHNNHCECGDCRETRPADLYVRLLNELDAAMRDRDIDTRVVFLAYTDLLWPPEETRIQHPDRFALMYAPIARSYTAGYGDIVAADAGPEIAKTDRPRPTDLPGREPYERNDVEFPSTVAGNVSYLQGWRERFDGDAFAYEYHLMRNQYDDPPGMDIAATLADDVAHLADVGLDGLLMCCTQRTFFPTGLGMYTLGEFLWDRERSFDAVADEYFAAAFGDGGEEVRAFLARLSTLFDRSTVTDDLDDASPDAAAAFETAVTAIDDFRPAIADGRDHPDAARARSWDVLGHFADVGAGLTDAFAARARGDEAAAARHWDAVEETVWRAEPEYHRVLDSYWFTRRLGEGFAERGEIGQL